MILLTVVQFLGVDKNTLFGIFAAIIPESVKGLIFDIIQEVYTKSIGTISISILFLLWSAGKGFFALCKGLNSAYQVKKKYNYFSIKLQSIISTIIFILLIVVTLLVLVFGNKINLIIAKNFGEIKGITNLIFSFSKIAVYVIMFIIFVLIYKFLPKHKVQLKYQLPGALIATLGWIVISYVFSIYLDVFSGFSVTYGSLTTVMLLFMWIYLCIYIVLFGAIVNKYIEKRGKVLLVKNKKNEEQKGEKNGEGIKEKN